MQGFVDGDTIRFYDPGLRLPGGEYERMFTVAMNKNPLYPFIEFSLTGVVTESMAMFNEDDIWLRNKVVGQILPALREGKIAKIVGLDEIRALKGVVAVFDRFTVGDEVLPTRNVNQRFCEIAVVAENDLDMKRIVDIVYKTLKIYDKNGKDMLVSKYDTEVFLSRAKIRQ
jgi:hypothetical protein